MRRISTALATLVYVLSSLVTALAQSAPAAPSVTVPRLIQITGAFQPGDGQPPSAVEIVTLSVYAEADGGLPVWQERQTVAIEKSTGRFTLLLGASEPAGIPAAVFASGDAQWMSLLFERAGEREQPRVRIASVPYALKASDAETLGGLPAAAYLRAPTAPAEGDSRETLAAVTATEAPISLAAVNPGTTNYLAKYVNASDVGKSAVYETPTVRVPTGAVGIGTTAPADVLHLRFTNTAGQITGLAVQNLGNTTASYSGMLFYDQFGATAQFQGFNNVTHEYRINNVATNGSINFMLGGASKFAINPAGKVGIGTTEPASTLDVNGNVTIGSGAANNVALTIRGPNEPADPNSAQDIRFAFASAGSAAVRAYRGSAWDTSLNFLTNHIDQGADAPQVRMVINHTGNVGIGTTSPLYKLDVTGRMRVKQSGPDTAGIWLSGPDLGNGEDRAFVGISNDTQVGFYGNTGAGWGMLMDTTSGNVGIGEEPSSPPGVNSQYKLAVNGSLRAQSNSAYAAVTGLSLNASPGVDALSFDGYGAKIQSVSGVGVFIKVTGLGNLVEGYAGLSRKFHIDNAGTYITGSDFAEALPALGDPTGYEPGDVLVASTDAPGRVERARRPYDSRVVGIYSTRPGMLGAEKHGTSRVDPDDVPVAIVGIVPTKVAAENGPVGIGDLLTTSGTAGHAMRCGDAATCVGAIVGKALEPLGEGAGIIRVLVMLR